MRGHGIVYTSSGLQPNERGESNRRLLSRKHTTVGSWNTPGVQHNGVCLPEKSWHLTRKGERIYRKIILARSPSYKYLTYFIHRSLPGWMFTTSDKTATGYHLDFTGCQKSRDKIGYHCLLCSDPLCKVTTLFWNSTSKTCIKRTPLGNAVVSASYRVSA